MTAASISPPTTIATPSLPIAIQSTQLRPLSPLSSPTTMTMPTLYPLQFDAIIPSAREQLMHIIFEYHRSKKNNAEIQLLTSQMPKGAILHLNLNGAVNTTKLIEMAIKRKLHWNIKKNSINKESSPKSKSIETVIKNEELCFADSLQLGVDKTNLNQFRLRQQLVNSLCQHLDFFELIEAVKDDLKAQKVQYAEIIVSLSDIANLTDPANQHKRKSIFQKRDDNDPEIRFIVLVDRAQEKFTGFQNQLNQSLEKVEACPEVVAFNIGGPEEHIWARQQFKDQTELLKTINSAPRESKCAMNAGELTKYCSSTEVMSTQIYDSVRTNPARIYSGLCIAHDANAEEVLKKMGDKRIPVAISLTHDYAVSRVEPEDHPLKMYLNRDIPVAFVTGFQGIVGTSQSDEFSVGFLKHKLDYFQLVKMARNSLHHSFLPGASIYDISDDVKEYVLKLKPAFKDLLKEGSGWHPAAFATSFLTNSQKALQQVAFEKYLCEFEKKIINSYYTELHKKNTPEIYDKIASICRETLYKKEKGIFSLD